MSNVDPFNPQADYDVPKGESRYMKFEDGQNKFLVLASAIIGWEYWNTENKPVRISEAPEVPVAELPNIRPDRDGQYRIKHFWAFPVIDCKDGKVKILEITQKGVQKAIRSYAENDEWGSPVLNYTITVTRSGANLDTEYQVQANPAKEIPAEWIAAWEKVQKEGFDLNALYKGDDPFKSSIKDEFDDVEVEEQEDIS